MMFANWVREHCQLVTAFYVLSIYYLDSLFQMADSNWDKR